MHAVLINDKASGALRDIGRAAERLMDAIVMGVGPWSPGRIVPARLYARMVLAERRRLGDAGWDLGGEG